VRRRPYSLLLLDEVEKAHPDVFNVLLQVLEDGRLTDGHGRTVDFRNTVIVMTSNLGSDLIQEMAGEANYARMKSAVLEVVGRYFRPEFINRIDEVLIFNILSPEAVKDIVAIQVREVVQRLRDKNITLSVSPAVLEYLAKEGYNPHYGARPLRRLIQDKILTKVATLMISKGVLSGGSVSVDMSAKGGSASGGKEQEFTFDVKKGGKRVKSPVQAEETPLTTN